MQNLSLQELSALYGPRYRWYAILATMLGTISMVLSTTIVNVALPEIMEQFRVGHDTVQWMSTGFLAATSATMLATAWLVNTLGQRNTFLFSLGLFVFASLLGGVSPNVELAILARVLQGAAAGLIQPLAMITIFQVFPAESRGSAMGLYGVGVVLGPAIGPALGGVLVEYFGWRSTFLIGLPFCLAGFVMGRKFLPGPNAALAKSSFDWLGLLLVAAFLISFLNLSVLGHRFGWTSWQIAGCACVALAALITFIVWQRRVEHPLLKLVMFSSGAFAAACSVAFAYGLGLFGTTYLIPQFVQSVAGFSPSQSGSLLLAPGIALAIAIGIAGRLTDRFPPHYMVMIGLVCFALSSLLFTRAQVVTGFSTLALWIIVGRIGLGLIIPSLNLGAMQVVEPAYLADASAAINFARQLGGAMGVNILAVFLEWRLVSDEHRLRAGEAAVASVPLEELLMKAKTFAFHDSFWVVTIIFTLALVPAWMMRKRGVDHV
jgi:MFS transporter, DHA2 family, multidrug resistance protein